MRSWIGGLAVGGLLALLGACSDDFGTPCNFPTSPEIQRFCAESTDSTGNPSTGTCVDPINPDCSSRLCVKFEGSDAFCSERCSSNGGCPSGASCQTPLGAGIQVCVPDRVIDG